MDILRKQFGDATREEILEMQRKKCEDIVEKLAKDGYPNFYIKTSVTSFGVSSYIYDMDSALKFRISDHATGGWRVLNEWNFTLKQDYEWFLKIVQKDREADRIAEERMKQRDKKLEELHKKWEEIKVHFKGLRFSTFLEKKSKAVSAEEFAKKGKFPRFYVRKSERSDSDYVYYEWAAENGKDSTPSQDWLEWFDTDWLKK